MRLTDRLTQNVLLNLNWGVWCWYLLECWGFNTCTLCKMKNSSYMVSGLQLDQVNFLDSLVHYSILIVIEGVPWFCYWIHGFTCVTCVLYGVQTLIKKFVCSLGRHSLDSNQSKKKKIMPYMGSFLHKKYGLKISFWGQKVPKVTSTWRIIFAYWF